MKDFVLKPFIKSLHFINPLSWGESFIYSVAKLMFPLINSDGDQATTTHFLLSSSHLTGTDPSVKPAFWQFTALAP